MGHFLPYCYIISSNNSFSSVRVSSTYSRANSAQLLCFSLFHIPFESTKHNASPLSGTVVFPYYETFLDSDTPGNHLVSWIDIHEQFSMWLKIKEDPVIPQIPDIAEALNTTLLTL